MDQASMHKRSLPNREPSASAVASDRITAHTQDEEAKAEEKLGEAGPISPMSAPSKAGKYFHDYHLHDKTTCPIP